jgi:hypothetical protein
VIAVKVTMFYGKIKLVVLITNITDLTLKNVNSVIHHVLVVILEQTQINVQVVIKE